MPVPRHGPWGASGAPPIAHHAAIGDEGRVALVAPDGCIDWLCVPGIGDPSVLGALLDPDAGHFSLRPAVPAEVRRRYLPQTNVLETTFLCAGGEVRVTEAVVWDAHGQTLPWIELVRRVEGVRGRVLMRVELRPRFGYGARAAAFRTDRGVPLATDGEIAVGLHAWGPVRTEVRGEEAVHVELTVSAGEGALIALAASHDGLISSPRRHQVELRLDRTIGAWRRWSEAHAYGGPWREEVMRSLLALELLRDGVSGGIAAAPTTSLPERLGGPRNWDYRFSWPRDSAFALDALIRAGRTEDAHRSFSWLLHALESTHPRVRPIYRLHDAREAEDEHVLHHLSGYRGSRPVRAGNAAARQVQLGAYGELLVTTWLWVREGNALSARTGRRLAEVADHVCDVWNHEDSGIWELHEPRHHTHSKIGCWAALDRALRLADLGQVPSERAGRWRSEAEAIREFVDARCRTGPGGAFRRAADLEEPDAALLMIGRSEFLPPDDPAVIATIEWVREELASGPWVHRYPAMRGTEGAFVACTFWLVEALARAGRLEEAESLMERALRGSSELGLYAEEIDPEDGSFLGNHPQALSHLSLVNAASVIGQVRAGRHAGDPGHGRDRAQDLSSVAGDGPP